MQTTEEAYLEGYLKGRLGKPSPYRSDVTVPKPEREMEWP